MVGLVVVSHSHALAVAVREMARQVAAPEVNIAVAAGVGDDRAMLGTDAADISAAIQSVDSPDGVLVLMDLGSAILSADMALELLPEAMRQRVRLCPAPLVEGALSAAVQAGLGADLDTVTAEALAALTAKLEQLSPALPALSSVSDAEEVAAALSTPLTTEPSSIIVTLRNPHGLHARPAARFVQTVNQFDAEVSVRKGTGAPVSAKSLNRLATLGAAQGDALTISARGPQAQQALVALRELVERDFGESAETSQARANLSPALNATNSTLQAIPISPGIAIGTLHYAATLSTTTKETTTHAIDAEGEWARLTSAIERTSQRILSNQSRVRVAAGAEQAAIFAAHLLILRDEELQHRAHDIIYGGQPPDANSAWQSVINELADTYRKLSDPYMQQRAADAVDVGAQVLESLSGAVAVESPHDYPVILMTEDITPAQVAQLDLTRTLGVVTRTGSATSHAAILLRALGIPAIAGVGATFDALPSSTTIAFDGSSGHVWVEPTPATLGDLTQQRTTWQAQQEAMRTASHTLTYTRDGQRVEVAVNLSGLADARVAVENGAEAVGVLRTEFLYLNRAVPPAEDEQAATLQDIAALMQGRPVIVRTLDVGGDKPLPYLPLPREANPYLGVRAIRISLLRPDIFITQVRAILRAATQYPIRILLPMVTLIEELQQARKLIEQAHQELMHEGIPHAWELPLGIMVETPAAALLADQFAPLVDFFSIGTNDLTQYTLAAERGNPDVAHLYDALHPAILLLIQRVVQAAHQHHKWAGVCGEVAADPLAVPILVGMDVDELSINVAAVPQVKAIIRGLEMHAVRELAQIALRASTAPEVRQSSRAFLESRGLLF